MVEPGFRSFWVKWRSFWRFLGYAWKAMFHNFTFTAVNLLQFFIFCVMVEFCADFHIVSSFFLDFTSLCVYLYLLHSQLSKNL